MPPTLHTARLVLTPVSERDLAPLHAHWNDPRVARFLWDAQPVPVQTVADLIAGSAQTFAAAGWGLWALRPTHQTPLIGVCGLTPFDPSPGIELRPLPSVSAGRRLVLVRGCRCGTAYVRVVGSQLGGQVTL